MILVPREKSCPGGLPRETSSYLELVIQDVPKCGKIEDKQCDSDSDSSQGQQSSQDIVDVLPTRCDHCGKLTGHFANHLRGSLVCLQAYRTYPEFGILGNNEEFVVKVCILSKNCPCPLCPGGSHWKIPTECLKWWTTTGWHIMKWKGIKESAKSSDIKKKISKYISNVSQRKSQSQGRAGSQLSEPNDVSQQSKDDLSDSVRGLNQMRDHGVEGQSEHNNEQEYC